MQTAPDTTVSDLDLTAYVDEQLDDWQRMRVEDHLSRHPDDAARVMHDIRLRRELRLALMPADPPPPGLRVAAARLDRAMRRDRRLRRIVRLVPVAALVVAGWLAHAGMGPLSVTPLVAAHPLPSVVEAAISARDAAVMRLSMRSQPQSPDLDVAEMRAATGILLPRFDRSWAMRDAQVFPSPQGPGIELVFDSADLGRVTHFAVRTGSFSVTMPHAQDHAGQSVAWFQIGETAHVLIADRGGADALEATARHLSETLY